MTIRVKQTMITDDDPVAQKLADKEDEDAKKSKRRYAADKGGCKVTRNEKDVLRHTEHNGHD